MSSLQSVLGENVGYYEDLRRRLKARLAELPEGSVLRRRLGKHDYFYLKLRRGSRVLSKYLGKKRPEELEESIKERRLLRRQLREVEQNLRLLRKMKRPRID